MGTNTNPFEWFEQELVKIKSRRFHILEPLQLKHSCLEWRGDSMELPADYAIFLKKFGRARLFTDHQDGTTLSVYPLEELRRHICENGKVYIGFGFRSYESVYFDEQELLSTGCSAVYVVNKKLGHEVASSFSEWFEGAYKWTRGKYSAGKWKKIVDGPAPFDDEEVKIVEARQQFKWRHIGFSEDGDALFEVENNSSRRLPYLSIGIQGKGGTILVGGAWLDVSEIEPGKKAVVKQNCYKDRISTSELEAFEKPTPIPEKKDAYWEFKRLSRKTIVVKS